MDLVNWLIFSLIIWVVSCLCSYKLVSFVGWQTLPSKYVICPLQLNEA
jgi:hypothetical protein